MPADADAVIVSIFAIVVCLSIHLSRWRYVAFVQSGIQEDDFYL
jgi:hypothetical protein